MSQQPTVGRIVHYFPADGSALDSEPFAAIVTRVWSDECVNLFICDDGSGRITRNIETSLERSDAPKAGCWMWPPRV